MAESIRSGGLFGSQSALDVLQGNPSQLGRPRVRFDEPPPPYTSDQSGTTTRAESPIPSDGEEYNRQRNQLSFEHHASECRKEYERQHKEELWRIQSTSVYGTGAERILNVNWSTLAHKRIKKRWTEQGIWDENWTEDRVGPWKHELPLELGSESETDPGASTPPASLFGLQRTPRRKKSGETQRREIESQRRDRARSRPYHQFIYQISKEQERIRNKSMGEEETYSDDVNTQAYNNVQARWRERKIWNDKWGIMPGMSWKHERSWIAVLQEAGLQVLPMDRCEEEREAATARRSKSASRPVSTDNIFGFGRHTAVPASRVSRPDPRPVAPDDIFGFWRDTAVPASKAPKPDPRPVSPDNIFGFWRDTAVPAPKAPDGRPPQQNNIFGHVPTSPSQSNVTRVVFGAASTDSHDSGAGTGHTHNRNGGADVPMLNSDEIDHSDDALDPTVSEQPQVILAAATRQPRKARYRNTTRQRQQSQSAQRSHNYQDALHDNTQAPLNRDATDRGPQRKNAWVQRFQAKQKDGVAEAAFQAHPKKSTASSARPQSSAKPQGIVKGRRKASTRQKKNKAAVTRRKES